jgi:hypothetical protein
MRGCRFLIIFSRCTVLGIMLMLANVDSVRAQTRQQYIVQYCNANDQGLINWFEANRPSMTPEQIGVTAMQVTTQLSPPCQSLMRWFGETQQSGVAQTVRPGECNRNQQNAMIKWNMQAGPHRIRTDCWNFPP